MTDKQFVVLSFTTVFCTGGIRAVIDVKGEKGMKASLVFTDTGNFPSFCDHGRVVIHYRFDMLAHVLAMLDSSGAVVVWQDPLYFVGTTRAAVGQEDRINQTNDKETNSATATPKPSCTFRHRGAGEGTLELQGDGTLPFRGDGTLPLRGDGTLPLRGDGTLPLRGDGTLPLRGDRTLTFQFPESILSVGDGTLPFGRLFPGANIVQSQIGFFVKEIPVTERCRLAVSRRQPE
jgi:hypothetical protein